MLIKFGVLVVLCGISADVELLSCGRVVALGKLIVPGKMIVLG